MFSIVLKAVEDVASDEQFWTAIRANMALRMGKVAREITVEGARAAESVGVIVDFDSINRRALEVTRTIETAWWRTLEDTTRQGLREAMVTWQEIGLGKRGLPDLIDSIEPLFSRERAKRIAVTETTRMFAEGNRMAAQEDPVVGGLQWRTAEDEKVCLICGPLNDQIFPKDAVPECPAHVNCRCDLVPVSWRYIEGHPTQWEGEAMA